jgi:hypothetical protein
MKSYYQTTKNENHAKNLLIESNILYIH